MGVGQNSKGLLFLVQRVAMSNQAQLFLSILKPDLKIFFCFFCAYLVFFLFFCMCVHFCCCFFLLFFSNLGLDWVLLFFFRGFETSHWITVKKDFDKV